MRLSKKQVYVADLTDVYHQWLSVPSSVRRPEELMPLEFSEDEVFSIEINNILKYVGHRIDSERALISFVSGFVNGYCDDVGSDTILPESELKMIDDYGQSIYQLGNNLVDTLEELMVYNREDVLSIVPKRMSKNGPYLILESVMKVEATPGP